MRTLTLLVLFLTLCTMALAGPRLSGTQSVAANGTPERLRTAGSLFCGMITVSGDANNTSIIVIGDKDVDATEASRTGLTLFPGQTEYISSPTGRLDVSETWVDVVTNDDGVSWNCLN